ncbi:Glycosyltransferase involved in cell wall bisynthesis [Allokutzneria albata]|uniref:Glycosyltransferase involved in cell wall bisynthesis n=1 Tax=Allokutzneria albata TaxID=211114 RepID=A0A1G9SEV3_ALLAB|nr:Glycosyltransferase involved in cell wall bisynthesis [Allokutzneria albata]
MRVVVLVNRYVPEYNAGSEVTMHRLARALAGAGHEVEVVVTWHLSRHGYHLDGIPVHQVSERDADDRIVQLSPDVILTQYDEIARAAWLRAQYGIPWVQLIHKDDENSRAALRLSAALSVFNTHWIAETFADHPGRSLVVHPPVNADEHRTRPGNATTLVNLIPDKGVEVFYALADRFPGRAFLGVVGGYGRQDIRTDRPNLRIHPHGPAMREVWGQTRVVLMPSLHESYGLVAVEAMVSGIPVIAHPTPGLREALGPGGLFADRNDLDAWAAALAALDAADRYEAASRYALARAREITAENTAELAAFVSAVESVIEDRQ